MTEPLALLMAQLNPAVGAIDMNVKKIVDIILQYQDTHDVILFPELVISGYPPEDLLLRPAFHDQVEEAMQTIASVTREAFVIIGHPCRNEDQCFNSASVYHQGKRIALYHKQELPNYGVFDEARYFKAGPAEPCRITVKGYQFGICICEDLWQGDPVEQLIKAGVDGILCLNASPFDYLKYTRREDLLRKYAHRGIDLIYLNMVGGQDELVFDGQSLAMDNTGQICTRMPAFAETCQTVNFSGKRLLKGDIVPLISQEQLIYEALVLGTRDYVKKNGFPGVLTGLSGGIDSALTLAIAVDALGASNVHAVMMPSRYTASISMEDAWQQLGTMQVQSTTLSIEPAFDAILTTLAPAFVNYSPDTTEENIQARIRGILLMALSNKTGKMVLTTSNKSESAVGYTTLYGDMAGGFSVLKDVFKTQVYALARYRNQVSPVIPERVLTRPPSAELAENQTDQDSLPDYAILDTIVCDYMEHNKSVEEIIRLGFSSEDVNLIARLITRNEYKRRQAAPGIKISLRAFGRDWRYPITSGFQ